MSNDIRDILGVRFTFNREKRYMKLDLEQAILAPPYVTKLGS